MPDTNDAPRPNKTQGALRKPAPETAYDRAVARAGDAIDASRDSADAFARRAAEGVEAAPLSVLAGGIALGVIAGLVIPRSEREAELLAPAGKRITDSVTAALSAAKEAGREELGAIGFGRDAARTQVSRMLEGALNAVGSAAAAAAKRPEGDAKG